MKEMSRRDLFKIGGVAAAGAMGASMLAGCSPSGEKKSEGGNAAADDKKVNDIAGHYRAGTPSFLSAPDPITDIKETKEYDVVIVGAGAAGVPAAISAKEAGATVALIQKEATAISQGNTATGILLDGSDPAGVSAVVSTLLKEHQFRGLAIADQPCEQIRAPAVWAETQPREREHERGLLAGKDQITSQRERDARPRDRSVERADDDLAHLEHGGYHLSDLLHSDSCRCKLLHHVYALDAAAGGKAAPRACQDQRFYFRIALDACACVDDNERDRIPA